MTDETQGIEVIEQDDAPAEGANETSQDKEDGESGERADVEAQARSMGWRPKDEWRGDPDTWRDADEFVERGTTMIPILNKRIEGYESEIGSLREEVATLKQGQRKSEVDAYSRAYRALAAKRRDAAAGGDMKVYDEAETEIAELEKARPKDEPEARGEAQEFDPIVKAWVDRTPWFNSDPDMTQYAATEHGILRSEKPGLSTEENLREVERRVRQRFPAKFGNVRRGGPGTVEGGSRGKGNGSGKRTFADLDDEGKKAFDELVGVGLMKNTKDDRQAYAESYFAQEQG